MAATRNIFRKCSVKPLRNRRAAVFIRCDGLRRSKGLGVSCLRPQDLFFIHSTNHDDIFLSLMRFASPQVGDDARMIFSIAEWYFSDHLRTRAEWNGENGERNGRFCRNPCRRGILRPARRGVLFRSQTPRRKGFTAQRTGFVKSCPSAT